ncbi:MAG TPA: arginine--tRNA ligase, partial [Opitutales bacterium]|nr:arginine--tRNA ligase [Opitutales bacterium]
MVIAKKIAAAAGMDAGEALSLLAAPPRPEMGDYAFPCFALAKTLKKAPPVIAVELTPMIAAALPEVGVEAAGPYINFRLDKKRVTDQVVRRVLAERVLVNPEGQGKTVVIDFSSPNIAKPFSMGHLRATTIGNALSRIYQALGYAVVRVNHLGDWGTQFGKLIVAYRMWGDDKELESREIDYLMEIYVRFNDEAKKDPALDDLARAAFKELEDGGTEARALWTRFREISLQEFQRLYDVLNVGFDSYNGESFYLDKVEPAIERIRAAGILEESEGALVVPMGEDEPPCMIRKSDGASTYAARDLAALFYRKETYNFDKLLYVVGSPQALHFRQVFSVVDKLGLPYAAQCAHVPFGQVLIGGEMMSTRKGNVVFLEDVIDKAAELALAKIAEDLGMQPEEMDADAVVRSRAIAVSSIIFFDLKNGRVKDVDFAWDEILNPKGETGV